MLEYAVARRHQTVSCQIGHSKASRWRISDHSVPKVPETLVILVTVCSAQCASDGETYQQDGRQASLLQIRKP